MHVHLVGKGGHVGDSPLTVSVEYQFHNEESQRNLAVVQYPGTHDPKFHHLPSLRAAKDNGKVGALESIQRTARMLC